MSPLLVQETKAWSLVRPPAFSLGGGLDSGRIFIFLRLRALISVMSLTSAVVADFRFPVVPNRVSARFRRGIVVVVVALRTVVLVSWSSSHSPRSSSGIRGVIGSLSLPVASGDLNFPEVLGHADHLISVL